MIAEGGNAGNYGDLSELHSLSMITTVFEILPVTNIHDCALAYTFKKETR